VEILEVVEAWTLLQPVHKQLRSQPTRLCPGYFVHNKPLGKLGHFGSRQAENVENSCVFKVHSTLLHILFGCSLWTPPIALN